MRVLAGGGRVVPSRRFTFGWLFEPRDGFVGVFWNRFESEGVDFLLVYVSLVPCFPLMFVLRRELDAGS